MAQSHILYWIWLSLCFTPGSKNADVLLEYFDENAQKIYEADDDTIDRLDLNPETKQKLKDKSSDEAKRIYYWCKDHNVRLLAYDDPAFPVRLRTIGRKPVLLYCKGKEIDLNGELLISAVGTRRMTSYGKRTAYSICYDLSRAGAVVISGMALGIDAVCHQAALDALGSTVAVLGCGIDIAYPKQNLDLMLALEKKGLVLTEYKPGTRPNKTTFPTRNRIISGISQATFVVEGDRQSGAMITAHCAKEQGRDLFALPGMVGEQNSEGTNALLRDGARPVTSAFDLLDNYALLYPEKVFIERIPIYRPHITLSTVKSAPKTVSGETQPSSLQSAPKAAPQSNADLPANASDPLCERKRASDSALAQLSETGRILLSELEKSADPLFADQLASRTKLNISDVMTELTMLEISGMVTSLPGGRFVV